MKYNEWVWKSELETHQKMIDHQHRTLFNVINDLIRACNMSPLPNGLLVEVALDELLKYAGYHFREEEELMEKSHYHKLAAHKEQHAIFVKNMMDFKARFDRNENIAHDLIMFMENWLINHIMTLDKAAMNECQ